jgi:hypothetical protein
MEKLLQAIKNNIKSHRQELGNNLLNKGVEDISEFKRIYGYNQGLNKALEIINDLVVKYRKGEVDDE